MESTTTIPKADKLKKTRRPWGENEETTLIIEVLEREELLFGEIKGAGIKSVHRKRTDAWQEVTDILNSQFVSTRRDPEEVKKKFFNSKQRMKEKIDRIRRGMRQTGGGPPPKDLSTTELMFWERMCHRPAISGLSISIDTDNNEEPSTSAETEDAQDIQSINSEFIEPACNRGEKRRSQASLTLENTEKDTERIVLETKKLQKEIELLDSKKAKIELETEKLKSEKEMLEFKKLYYQLAIQKEYGVLIQTEP